jgi:type I restriction enzyme R subunit
MSEKSMTTQSEQVLEDTLMTLLISKDYEWAKVTDEASMLANLKTQLEDFNRLSLTDGEFSKVLHHLNKKSGVFNKAHILRDRMLLTKEDGNTVYLEFFDSTQPLRNRYQVTQQVKMEGSYKKKDSYTAETDIDVEAINTKEVLEDETRLNKIIEEPERRKYLLKPPQNARQDHDVFIKSRSA